VNEKRNPEFFEVLEENFDDRIIDEHYEKGKTERPYLGFDECALPVILYHNTPNNSVAVLWYSLTKKDGSFQGLFPRIDRHQEGWQ
jgi:hypothetical protein